MQAMPRDTQRLTLSEYLLADSPKSIASIEPGRKVRACVGVGSTLPCFNYGIIC